MSQRTRALVRMAIFAAAVLAIAAVLAAPLYRAFAANFFLNGLILVVLFSGAGFCVRRVLSLGPVENWLDEARAGTTGEPPPAHGLLAPLAALLTRDGGRALSPTTARALIDSVAGRLEESREITRYMVGLLVFLGLLGTFWGLLQTISAVGETIASLPTDDAEGSPGALFETLKAGLAAPLDGMGTAFSSSLFGLGASLVLGFLDLQASQTQSRFLDAFEDWLGQRTHLGATMGFGEGVAAPADYLGALIEQSAENNAALERTVARSADTAASLHGSLRGLVERLSGLGDLMRAEQQVLVKLAQSHTELTPLIEQIVSKLDAGPTSHEDATLSHLRNIDAALKQLVTDAGHDRTRMLDELRGELRLVARILGSAPGDKRSREDTLP